MLMKSTTLMNMQMDLNFEEPKEMEAFVKQLKDRKIDIIIEKNIN